MFWRHVFPRNIWNVEKGVGQDAGVGKEGRITIAQVGLLFHSWTSVDPSRAGLLSSFPKTPIDDDIWTIWGTAIQL